MAEANSSPVTGRFAIVTGANRGIGFEICKQLAAKGITVVLTARDEKRGREAAEKLRGEGGLSGDVVFHQVDVIDPASVASLVDFIKTRFGKLDILTCKEIDKIQRSFIWGSDGERKKLHWVSWANMCKHKKIGGLGLRETTIINEAFVAKLEWKILTEPNLLWARILKEKYFRHGFLNYSPKSSDSNVCWGILKGKELLNEGLQWVVYNGKKICFWLDRWVSNSELLHLAILPVPEAENELLIDDYTEEDGS